jgi:hypothetical protein
MKEDLSLVPTSNSVGDFSPGKCDRTNDMQKTRIVYFWKATLYFCEFTHLHLSETQNADKIGSVNHALDI